MLEVQPSQDVLTAENCARDVHVQAQESYLVQSQHVEVADVVLLSMSDPRPALLLVDHLSHILAHKVTLRRKKQLSAGSAARQARPPGPPTLSVYLLDVVDAAKTPAPRKRPEDLHLAVLAFGECLVEAALTRWTNLQVWRISIGFGCRVKQRRERDGGISLPAGGIRTTACG